MASSLNRDWTTPRHHYKHLDQGGASHHFHAGSSMEASRTTTSSRDEPSVSNASEMETEWVEQDEPGVYITIRQLADGTRELRRVRFRYNVNSCPEHVTYDPRNIYYLQNPRSHNVAIFIKIFNYRVKKSFYLEN